MELSLEHRTSLHVLAYLYFRMGRMANAGHIYAALAALPPGHSDWRAYGGQAAVALEQGDGEMALVYIRTAMELSGHLPDVQTTLHRMHAKALWLCGNKDKAREMAESSLYTGR